MNEVLEQSNSGDQEIHIFWKLIIWRPDMKELCWLSALWRRTSRRIATASGVLQIQHHIRLESRPGALCKKHNASVTPVVLFISDWFESATRVIDLTILVLDHTVWWSRTCCDNRLIVFCHNLFQGNEWMYKQTLLVWIKITSRTYLKHWSVSLLLFQLMRSLVSSLLLPFCVPVNCLTTWAFSPSLHKAKDEHPF